MLLTAYYCNQHHLCVCSLPQGGYVGVLKALVQHGVDVNDVDSTGYTALHMAGKELEATLHKDYDCCALVKLVFLLGFDR